MRKLRLRAWTRGGLVGLLTAGVLALVPVAPAAAIQTIGWTQSPPSTAMVGNTVSFRWTGTANTFLGARITGCFANFPDGSNYTYSFGGNFTTGNCSYFNRPMTVVGNYAFTVGFTLSSGGTMVKSGNVNVTAPPTPTVNISGDVLTTASGVDGARAFFSAWGTDSYYGTSPATCTPASGSTFPVGDTTVTCSATNYGGATGWATLRVTVLKAEPDMVWSQLGSVSYGTTYGDLMTARVQTADATGTITYARGDGTPVSSGDVVPVGAGQLIRATYTPSGAALGAYFPVDLTRTVTVVPAASAVVFASGTPTSKQYGDNEFPVTAEGTPGAGTVTISTQSGSACTVSDPTTGTSVTATVTLTGGGTCVLLADQAAVDTHTAAPTAQWSVTVARANPQITWAPPATLTYGQPVSALFRAVADAPGTITYLVDGTAVAPDTVLDVGDDRVISMVFTPDQPADYVGTTADRTFSVAPAAQTVTLEPVDDQVFGGGPVDLTVGGTGPGQVGVSATGSCTASGVTLTLVSAGECTVTAHRWATDNHAAAEPVTRTFQVARAVPELTWAPPAGIAQGVPLGAEQLAAVASVPGSMTYTVDGGTEPAVGQVLAAGDHVLEVRFVPTDDNYTEATLQVPLTVLAPTDVPDTLGAGEQHGLDEQRVETQADLSAGETRSFSVTCPSGYVVIDGSARVDAVDQGTGTLADVRVLESRATSPGTWTATMVNQAEGRAQAKVFADCVQAETASYDGHRHALVLRDADPQTVALDGSTTVTLECGPGRRPVAAGYELDGAAVVRRSSPGAAGEWVFEVVPDDAGTTGTFSARCLDLRVTRSSGHDHRLGLTRVSDHVTVGAGQSVEAQVTCSDLARGVAGGWSLDDGLVLVGAEPRAKTRAVRLVNPTGGPLSADLVVECLEVRTEGGASDVVPPGPSGPVPSVPAAPTALPGAGGALVTGPGSVVATVRCESEAAACSGTAVLVATRDQRVRGRLLRAGTVLARASFSLRAGASGQVVLRATRAGRRTLDAPGLRRARLSIGDETRNVRLHR